MKKYSNIEVHIDAENISCKKIKLVFNRISGYGNIKVKRCYADFSKPSVKPWLDVCNEHAITPCQANTIISGKNTSDFELVKSCTFSMAKERSDLMVIISSDSDFTSLVRNLRESGIYTIGVGEHKSPTAFRNAYDEFWFLEDFYSTEPYAAVPTKKIIIRRRSTTSNTGHNNEHRKYVAKNLSNNTLDDIIVNEILKIKARYNKNWITVEKLNDELKKDGISFDAGLNVFLKQHKDRFLVSNDYNTNALIVTENRNYTKQIY